MASLSVLLGSCFNDALWVLDLILLLAKATTILAGSFVVDSCACLSDSGMAPLSVLPGGLLLPVSNYWQKQERLPRSHVYLSTIVPNVLISFRQTQPPNISPSPPTLSRPREHLLIPSLHSSASLKPLQYTSANMSLSKPSFPQTAKVPKVPVVCEPRFIFWDCCQCDHTNTLLSVACVKQFNFDPRYIPTVFCYHDRCESDTVRWSGKKHSSSTNQASWRLTMSCVFCHRMADWRQEKGPCFWSNPTR